MEKASRFGCLFEKLAMLSIASQWHGAHLCLQLLFARRLEENLIVPQGAKLSGGFVSRDASLMSTKVREECFQSKIVGW